MANLDLLRPKSYPFRKATDQGQKNGNIINPPIFAEQGGLSGPGKIERSWNNLEKAGGEKRII
jgi:hypothetical protein